MLGFSGFGSTDAASYRSALRALALDYYHRRISFIDFRLRMASTISSGLTKAWLIGRENTGKRPSLSIAERIALQREISSEISHISKLVTRIDELVAGEIGPEVISRRLDLWGDAFTHAQAMSLVYNGGNIEYQWVLHPAEHCRTCLSLEGQIKKAKEWFALGYYPKSWKLDCRRGCKCELKKVV